MSVCVCVCKRSVLLVKLLRSVECRSSFVLFNDRCIFRVQKAWRFRACLVRNTLPSSNLFDRTLFKFVKLDGISFISFRHATFLFKFVINLDIETSRFHQDTPCWESHCFVCTTSISTESWRFYFILIFNACRKWCTLVSSFVIIICNLDLNVLITIVFGNSFFFGCRADFFAAHSHLLCIRSLCTGAGLIILSVDLLGRSFCFLDHLFYRTPGFYLFVQVLVYLFRNFAQIYELFGGNSGETVVWGEKSEVEDYFEDSFKDRIPPACHCFLEFKKVLAQNEVDHFFTFVLWD